MKVVRTPAEVRSVLIAAERPIGLVPTMGALHAGHLALVSAAREECNTVVASLFVNPLQFGPTEDFDRYPRAFEDDVRQFESAGVDLVYAPSVDTMYPAGFGTTVDPGPVAERYEGALRPGHFRGVATVCVKLFDVVSPARAYFGQKDAQQCAVLERVVRDLDLPVEIVVRPTIREDDGLALSSRNVYLTEDERAAAPALYRAVSAIAQAVRDGETDRDRAVARGRAKLVDATREAYLDVVDPATFAPHEHAIRRPAIAIGSVYLGKTRLLDNVPILRQAGDGAS